MATYTLHKKVHLLVDFLIGMRLPEPHEILVAFGWSTEELDLGWTLVERAGRARFSEERIVADRVNAELVEFKKRWFSVVRLTLGKRSPRVAALLLGGCDLSSQASAGFLVEPFLTSLAELETSADPDERAARQLLHERGLTAEVCRAAAELVEQSRQLISTKPSAELFAAEASAEAELWDFYLEWSGLARRAISNRNLLRCLGLNKAGRPARESEKESALKENTQLKKKRQQIGNARSERPTMVLVASIVEHPGLKILKGISHEKE